MNHQREATLGLAVSWTVLSLIAVLLLAGSIALLTPTPQAAADGAGSPTACLGTTPGVDGSIAGTVDEVSHTVQPDQTVTGVCIRAGNNMFEGRGHSGVLDNGTYEDGCYQVSGVGTQTVTVERVGEPSPSCQEISHIDVVWEEEEPVGEALLTITKLCDPPGDDGEFEIFLDGQSLGEISCGESIVDIEIGPGVHTVSEEGATGTDLDDYGDPVFGGDCAPDGDVEVGGVTASSTVPDAPPNGPEELTCTITNTRLDEETGSLAVLKTCTDGEGEFTFNLYNSDDQLIDTLTVGCGETATFADLPAGSGYYVEEETTEGFTETGNTCTNETVVGGQTASCTMTNTPDQEETGSLAVLKTCTDGEGEFTFNLYNSDDELIDTLTVGCGETATFTDLPAGSGYYVEEEPTEGFTETGSTCTNETVVGGETASCTITNTPDEDELGSIAVFKDCFPDADAQADFTFTLYNSDEEVVDSETVGCGETATFTGLEAGGYYVLETDLAPGYEQTGSTCDEIDLDIGEDFDCTISNELVVEETGSIDALKACNPGADSTADFTFTLYDASDDSVVDTATVGCEETASFLDLPAGDYYVIETGTPDTFTQFDTNCDAISLDPGEDESCTITNIEEEEVIVEPSAPQTIVIIEAQPPAAPVEPTPVAEVQAVTQVITPPSTGDGGLADSEQSRGFMTPLLMLAGVTGLVTALSVRRLRHLKRR